MCEATMYFYTWSIFVLSKGESDLHPQEHPIVDKDFRLDDFQSFENGILHLVGVCHGLFAYFVFCISPSIRYSRIERRSIVFLTNFPIDPCFFCARNARTCSRSSRHSSMIGTLCTAFWVPFPAIHRIRCYHHSESFVLILDWKD